MVLRLEMMMEEQRGLEWFGMRGDYQEAAASEQSAVGVPQWKVGKIWKM